MKRPSPSALNSLLAGLLATATLARTASALEPRVRPQRIVIEVQEYTKKDGESSERILCSPMTVATIGETSTIQNNSCYFGRDPRAASRVAEQCSQLCITPIAITKEGCSCEFTAFHPYRRNERPNPKRLLLLTPKFISVRIWAPDDREGDGAYVRLRIRPDVAAIPWNERNRQE